MKYIRLKDGRIIVQGEPSDKGFEQGRFEVHNFGNAETLTPFGNDDILVESSSIEELCDAFVKKSKEQDNDYFNVGTDAKVVFDKKYGATDLVHYHYYGAIFTERGLIYVAELNDKGELKLLWNTKN